MTLRTPGPVLVLGGLTVALVDGLDAVILSRTRGIGAGRVFQGIASGLLGRASFNGGTASIALGVAVHVTIATAAVLVLYAAASRWPALTRRPWAIGPAYGVLIYLFMNLVVIPLSAIGLRPVSRVQLVNGLLIHALGVGLPAALFVRQALSMDRAART
jgi:hypothetical protein